jgi:hypothetical protein
MQRPRLSYIKAPVHAGSQRSAAATYMSLSLSLTLRPTVSRPVYRGIKHSSGAYDQIYITVRQLRVC